MFLAYMTETGEIKGPVMRATGKASRYFRITDHSLEA